MGHIQHGLQLEVEVSGLRGRLEQFSVFHEFTILTAHDEALRAEAADLALLTGHLRRRASARCFR